MYRLWSAVRSTILPTTIQKWMLPPNLSGAIPARWLIITGIDSVTGTYFISGQLDHVSSSSIQSSGGLPRLSSYALHMTCHVCRATFPNRSRLGDAVLDPVACRVGRYRITSMGPEPTDTFAICTVPHSRLPRVSCQLSHGN